MHTRLKESLIPKDDGNDLTTRFLIESEIQWKIVLPSILYSVTTFGSIVITQLFIGHVDYLSLAAFALVQSIFLRFVTGILLGMSSATETLCGQAFGAGQYHMMGIYLQRSWIVDSVTATILLPLFIFAAPIFKLFGLENELAIESGKLAIWCIPLVYSSVFGMTIQMFLQAQLKNTIIGCLATATFVLHVLLSWVLVTKLGFGVQGAITALNISSWSMVLAEVVYVFGGWCPDTWTGFSMAAFSDIMPVVKLSVSSGVMLCLELWYNAVLVLVAGYMPDATTAISAFSICLNICTWELMICLGFLTAACVRVSNGLGRGNANGVKFSIKVSLFTNGCIGVIFWILCLAFGNKISYLFTSDEEVAKIVSSLSVLLSFTVLLNSVQTVLVGVVIGAGLQSIAAIVNLGSYYVIGVPFGIFLAYVAHLEVYGLWIGLLSGMVVQISFFLYVMWKTDWDEQVKKTSDRLNAWVLKPKEENIETFVS